MHKIKYYLWLVGFALCLNLNTYATDNSNIYTSLSTSANTTLLNNSNTCCDTSVEEYDCDGDGLNNGEELTGNDDPETPLNPNGIMSDPNNACDPFLGAGDEDCDGDGLTNDEETSDPTVDDPTTPLVPTGMSDPANKCDPFPGTGDEDCDGDGLTNDEENTNGTDPADRCSPGFVGEEEGSNAIELSINGACTYGTNFCAPDEGFTPPGCENNKAGVWYRFTVTQAGYYEIKTSNTNFNNTLSLFGGGNLCVNEDKFSFGEHLYRYLTPREYHITVSGSQDGVGVTEGEFCVEVNTIPSTSIPDNQDKCDANVPLIDLNTNPEACVTGSNRYASSANPQPSCSPYTGASVWYKIQMPSSGDKIQINAATHYSEVITIYEGTCGSLTEIACKMNGPHSSEGLVAGNLVSGDIYYMQVTGNFVTIEAENGTTCSDNYITISTTLDCQALCDQPCDDNNPDTINDMWDANCNCIGTCLYNGDTCDDGDDSTEYDTFDGQCNCVQCEDGQYVGISCNDGNPYTDNDAWDTDCKCIGTCTQGTCEDGNPHTTGETLDANCNCTGGTCTVGDPCDDGDSNTENDALTASCKCIGESTCVDDIIVDANNVSQGLFEASNSIMTELDGGVSVDESLELDAGNYILLRPGFTANDGTYLYAYIDGCETGSEPKTDESAFNFVKHYPNPFKDEFTLEFTLDVDATVRIIVADVNGRNVAQTSLNNLNQGIRTHNVNTKNWIAGMYFYQIQIKEINTGILKYANGTLVKM